MSGRNRSRSNRQPMSITQQVTRHRQRSTRYDRQRAATRHREWAPLPWQVVHRNHLDHLSVGGCY